MESLLILNKVLKEIQCLSLVTSTLVLNSLLKIHVIQFHHFIRLIITSPFLGKLELFKISQVFSLNPVREEENMYRRDTANFIIVVWN